MNADIMNLYVQRLLNEVGELTKTRLLLETQLQYNEAVSAQQQQLIDALQLELESLNNPKPRAPKKSEINSSPPLS